MRRYYPGFLAAFLLVALRLAIGWHLFYEGLDKIQSQSTPNPFSAEGYLRASTGPFAERFRSIVPDVDSLNMLQYDYLESTWEEALQRVARHYQFSETQLEDAETVLETVKTEARGWFEGPETQQQISDYQIELREVRQAELDPPQMAFERERLEDRKAELESQRRALAGRVEGWTNRLRDAWKAIAEDDQLRTAGLYEPPKTDLDVVNMVTMYGLLILGLLLIVGLATPLAALGAAGLLMMFYFAMPPWPGLPPNPMAEGTYLIINKTLIEALALLAIAALPTGFWFGLDALAFGWIGRRSRAAAETQAAEPARAS